MVEELAHYLIAATAREDRAIDIIFTGPRPVDKLEELLSSSYESAVARHSDLFSMVQPEGLFARNLNAIWNRYPRVFNSGIWAAAGRCL